MKADNRPLPSVPTEEELLRVRQDLMDLAGIGIYRYALDGTILHMDRGALCVAGIEDQVPDPSAVVGRQLSELFQYEETPGRLRQRVLRDGSVRGLMYPFRTLSGRRKWCIHDAYLVQDPETGDASI